MNTFEILWYDAIIDERTNTAELNLNRVVGHDYVKRHDLTDAITAACNMLKSGKGESGHAHGFFVRVSR